MLESLCLLISIAILFFVLKFRVHIHVTYTRPSSGRRAEAKRALKPTAMTRPVSTGPKVRNVAGTPSGTTRLPKDPGKVYGEPRLGVRTDAAEEREAPSTDNAPLFNDLMTALVGLGTKRSVAKEAAHRALAHQYADLETSLRRAIDYAMRSNAA